MVPATAQAEDILAHEAGRHIPVERPRRSGRDRRICGARDQEARRLRQARLRHLPRPSDAGAGARRQDAQDASGPSRRQSSGEGLHHRQGRDHLDESRLHRRSRDACPKASSKPMCRCSTAPIAASRSKASRSSRCSITRKPRPARRTATISSSASSSRWTRRRLRRGRRSPRRASGRAMTSCVGPFTQLSYCVRFKSICPSPHRLLFSPDDPFRVSSAPIVRARRYGRESLPKSEIDPLAHSPEGEWLWLHLNFIDQRCARWLARSGRFSRTRHRFPRACAGLSDHRKLRPRDGRQRCRHCAATSAVRRMRPAVCISFSARGFLVTLRTKPVRSAELIRRQLDAGRRFNTPAQLLLAFFLALCAGHRIRFCMILSARDRTHRGRVLDERVQRRAPARGDRAPRSRHAAPPAARPQARATRGRARHTCLPSRSVRAPRRFIPISTRNSSRSSSAPGSSMTRSTPSSPPRPTVSSTGSPSSPPSSCRRPWSAASSA